MDIGDRIVDFQLPQAGGGTFDSAAVRGGKRLVLVFFRGAW